MTTPDAEKQKPGPDPERVKIEKRDWKKAVKEALNKEKPEKGWPKDGGSSNG